MRYHGSRAFHGELWGIVVDLWLGDTAPYPHAETRLLALLLRRQRWLVRLLGTDLRYPT
jgi:hypothetical protein